MWPHDTASRLPCPADTLSSLGVTPCAFVLTSPELRLLLWALGSPATWLPQRQFP